MGHILIHGGTIAYNIGGLCDGSYARARRGYIGQIMDYERHELPKLLRAEDLTAFKIVRSTVVYKIINENE